MASTLVVHVTSQYMTMFALDGKSDGHELTAFPPWGALAARIGLIASIPSIFTIIIIAIALFSQHSMNIIDKEIERIALGASSSSKLAAHVAAMNTQEFRMASQPDPGMVAVARERIKRENTLFNLRLREIRKVASAPELRILSQVEELAKDYQKELDITFKATTDYDGEQRARAVHSEAEVSLNAVGRLRLAISSLSEEFEVRLQRLRQQQSDWGNGIAQGLVGIGIIGSAATIILGYLLGKRWVVEPLMNIVDVISALSKGEVPPDIPGTERPDEIGTLARAVTMLRDRDAERIRMQNESLYGHSA